MKNLQELSNLHDKHQEENKAVLNKMQDINQKNGQSSVEISRVKHGWLHRRSQTAAINMMYRGRVGKKAQRTQREEAMIRNSGGDMCRPWTPRQGRDEMENAE